MFNCHAGCGGRTLAQVYNDTANMVDAAAVEAAAVVGGEVTPLTFSWEAGPDAGVLEKEFAHAKLIDTGDNTEQLLKHDSLMNLSWNYLRFRDFNRLNITLWETRDYLLFVHALRFPLCARRKDEGKPKYLNPKHKPVTILRHDLTEESLVTPIQSIIVVEGLVDGVAVRKTLDTWDPEELRQVAQQTAVMVAYGRDLTDDQWYALRGKSVVFAFDNDSKGYMGAQNAVKEAVVWDVNASILPTYEWSPKLKDHAQYLGLANPSMSHSEWLYDKYVRPFSAKNYDREQLEEILSTTAMKRLPTGVKELDKRLGGGLPEGLTGIGAPPSEGKSSLVTFIAHHNWSKGRKSGLICTYENSPSQVWARLGSRELNRDWVRLEKDFTHLSKDECDDMLSFVNSDPRIAVRAGWSFADIERYVRKHSPDFVIIDYLQVMPGPYGGTSDSAKRLNTDWNATKLAAFAVERGIPIIAVSEVNRSSYGQVDISSFKESGAIEYRSTVLIGLNNPTGHPTKKVLSVVKNTRGPRSAVSVDTRLETQNWWGVSDYDYAPPVAAEQPSPEEQAPNEKPAVKMNPAIAEALAQLEENYV